jgi:WD40 repeat protein
VCLCGPIPATAQTAKQNPPRLDQYGDPLPDGALLRIGTLRMRPGGVVSSMAFTPDSKRLVTACDATGIQVWDVATGKEVLAFGAPADRHSALVAANGQRAGLRTGGIYRIYDTATGKEIAGVEPTARAGYCLSPDATLLAAFDLQENVEVWDPATGKVCKKWFGQVAISPGEIVAAVFSPDNRTLAFQKTDRELSVWDAPTGKLVKAIPINRSWWHLDFSPDGKILALCETKGKLRRWRTDTWEELANEDELKITGGRLAFSRDSQTLVVASEDNLHVLNAATGKLIRTMNSGKRWLKHIACSADGKWLATVAWDDTLAILDLAIGQPLHPVSNQPQGPLRVKFLSDGTTLLAPGIGDGKFSVFGYRQTFDLWDATTAKHLRQIAWNEHASVAALSGNGQMIAWSNPLGEITVRQRGGKSKDLRIADSATGRGSLQLSANGQLLLVQPGDLNDAEDGQAAVRMWDAKTGQLLWQFKGLPGQRYLGQFGPDEEQMVIARWNDNDFQLSVFNAFTGQKRFGPPLSWIGYAAVYLTPSCRRVVVFDGKNVASMYDVASRQLVRRLPVDSEFTECCVHSPDGNLIAVGTRKGRLHVWDALTGQKRATIDAHRGGVLSVDFAPDGKRLVTSGGDTTMLIWDATPWYQPTKAVTPAEAAALWKDLGSADAERALNAVAGLARGGKEAIALLKEQLHPVPLRDPTTTRKWIADLDGDKFAQREKAMGLLLALAERAVPALEEVLAGKPTLEMRRRVEILLGKLEKQPLAPAVVQTMRALEALELAVTPEAAALLETMAQGDPDALVTQDAAAALRRVTRRLK